MNKIEFGTTSNGKDTFLYELTNINGMVLALTDFGAAIVRVEVPVSDKKRDVVWGFDSVSGYESDVNPYFGAICGRVANRIGKARFELDGKEYTLIANDGENQLHGGALGYSHKVWDAEVIADNQVKFDLTSPHGEQGFPGNVFISVIYTLSDENEIKIEYRAVTDHATPINLTNHAYWNLAGSGSGTVLNHQLKVNALFYEPVNADSIPTGEIIKVADSPFDLREFTSLGENVNKIDGDPSGYDHNYILNKRSGEIGLAAILVDRGAVPNLSMEVWTSEPGIQVYSGNYLDGFEGKGGNKYPFRSAICLETQNYPDAINQKHFPNSILRPGEEYTSTTVHKFKIED
ncbi:MAG: galactose mutarotase [Lentisphaeria bacterium]|nr:galactose mutarotase [Lentisphaeria bacterium]